MKFEIELGDTSHAVEIPRLERSLHALIDGRSVSADAIEIARGTYSILIDGQSFEVRVERFADALRVTVGGSEYTARVRDPRKWQRNRNAALSSEARQKILAPMPGRIVRILVAHGDSVATGQGLVVVEAMKMQNEVRSPKSGSVERLLVKEGQAVNAGETIAIIA